MNITTHWLYSHDWEARRIINTAIKISNGFYQTHGFAVLPRLISGNARAVHFPQLDYQSIPDFWSSLVSLDSVLLSWETDIHLSAISNLMHQQGTGVLTDDQVLKLQKGYQQIEPRLLDRLLTIFPQLQDLPVDITIIPTRYGTDCSFNGRLYRGDQLIQDYIYPLLDDTSDLRAELKIWIRADHPDSIPEGIVSALVARGLRTQLDYTWEETEAYIDILLAYSFADLIGDYQPTLQSLRAVDQTQRELESYHYLTSLGVSTQQTLQFQNQKICVNGQALTDLSLTETKLIELFIENRGQIVTIEDLADIIWPDDLDSFSPWAITKHIQRLRSKLQTAGLGPDAIKTKRNQGYILVK